MNIKLNCDLGEGFEFDEQIMPYINMANIACGYHAGDTLTMQKSVELAVLNKVEIGAHPGYPDKKGFGRRSMNCTSEEIKTIVLYQLGALDAFCKKHGVKVTYVKPHGALYNDMVKNVNIFIDILESISSYDKDIKLMILSTQNNKSYNQMASRYGISLIYEVFADRNYNDDGTLLSRTLPNAIIENESDVLNIIQTLKEKNYIKSINGKKLHLDVDSICVHGDNEKALDFIKILRQSLN